MVRAVSNKCRHLKRALKQNNYFSSTFHEQKKKRYKQYKLSKKKKKQCAANAVDSLHKPAIGT